MNVDAEAYRRWDDLYSMAAAQHECDPAFWLRGLIPKGWTALPPPPDQESWYGSGNFLDGIVDGMLGDGALEAPVVLFGDASGGPDTKDPRFRRVGCGLVHVMSEADLSICGVVMGSLPGRQTVAHGELYMLYLSLRFATVFVVYIYDR